MIDRYRDCTEDIALENTELKIKEEDTTPLNVIKPKTPFMFEGKIYIKKVGTDYSNDRIECFSLSSGRDTYIKPNVAVKKIKLTLRAEGYYA